MARACPALSSSVSVRGFRLLPTLAAWALLSAPSSPTPLLVPQPVPQSLSAPLPLGDRFYRLDRGRSAPATLPAGTRLIAVYHGAGWCGPCRAFVPQLIVAYPRLRARGIEVLFVSADTTCAAALDYARTSRMPWLLLPCDAERQRRLRRLGGEALPGIVVLDAAGRQVDSSWQADGHSTPRRTLRRLLQ